MKNATLMYFKYSCVGPRVIRYCHRQYVSVVSLSPLTQKLTRLLQDLGLMYYVFKGQFIGASLTSSLSWFVVHAPDALSNCMIPFAGYHLSKHVVQSINESWTSSNSKYIFWHASFHIVST